MIKRKWLKRLLLGVGLLILVAAVFQYASLWLEYKLLYGPEQRLAKVISPDGTQIAHFSVKYEGPTPWWPANPKPHFYITVLDTKSGKELLRETDYDWPQSKPYRSSFGSFNNLAHTFAPWAETRIEAGAHSPIMP